MDKSMECPHCEGVLEPESDPQFSKKCSIPLSPGPSSSEILRYKVRGRWLQPCARPGHCPLVLAITWSWLCFLAVFLPPFWALLLRHSAKETGLGVLIFITPLICFSICLLDLSVNWLFNPCEGKRDCTVCRNTIQFKIRNGVHTSVFYVSVFTAYRAQFKLLVFNSHY